MSPSDFFSPFNTASLTAASAGALAPGAHCAAMRLYGRMKRRQVLLKAPLPQPIREYVVASCLRDSLVLVWAIYVDATGRRFTARTRVVTPREAHTVAVSCLLHKAWTEEDGRMWRLVHQGALWPSVNRNRWADLAF